MKTKVTSFVVLFAISSLMAQSDPSQSGGTKKHHSKTPDVTLQGCLGTQKGDYVLMQTDPGNTYGLESSHKINLGAHIGEEVEVSGWERPSLATSSDTFVPNRGVSSVTIEVKSVRMLAKRCTVGGFNANQEVAPAAAAQLEISSMPTNAEIEIDGNFVGDTPSTIGIAAGQHQLVLRKSNYKPWEKKITITSGQISVKAELEAQVK